MPSPEATQASFAGALRQVFNQLLRMLEEPDPSVLLSDRGAMAASLESWRKTIAAQTADPSIQKVRMLQDSNLELRGKVAVFEKECRDLKERNESLRDELVKLNQREETIKQRLFDAQFDAKTHKEEAKVLDLEVRDLRRQVRKLEGGPPLTPSEAAPRATKADKTKAKTTASSPQTEVQATDQAELSMEAMRAAPSSARNAVEEAFKSMWKQPPPPVVEEVTPEQAAPEQAAPKATPKRAAAKKTAPKKTASKKAAPKKAAPKKTAPKKSASKKTASKKTPPKKAAPKKAAPKKAAPKKAAPKKAASKKATPKKAAPKQAPASKKAESKKVEPKKAETKKKAAAKKPGVKKKAKTKRSAA